MTLDIFTEARRSLFSRFRWSTAAYVVNGQTFFRVLLRCGPNLYEFRIEPWENSTHWRRNFANGVKDVTGKAVKVAWRDGVK